MVRNTGVSLDVLVGEVDKQDVDTDSSLLLRHLPNAPCPSPHHTHTHTSCTIYDLLRCSSDMVPTEVLENIFTYLVPREGGYYDLWQSSLVCRAWRDPAQRLTFRAIRIFSHKEWMALVSIVTQDVIIGYYIIDVTLQLNGRSEESLVVEEVSKLLPCVTTLRFFHCMTSLEFASQFPQLTSMVVTSKTHAEVYITGGILPLIALTNITCPPSTLSSLLDWVDQTASLQRQSLTKMHIAFEWMSRYNTHHIFILRANLARLFKSYRSLQILSLHVYDSWSEMPNGMPLQLVIFTKHAEVLTNSTMHLEFGMGEAPITHLHIHASENACPAIFGILRTTLFPNLAHVRIQLQQADCKHDLYEFEPANIDSYGVPHGLSLRLETVVIEADGWRDRDDSWYEQVAMLFGPAYREDVLVLNLSDQYFPDQVKIGNDYSADSLEDEGGELSDDYDWWPLDEREANRTGRSKVREPGEVPYLSSSDEGDDEEDEGNEGKVDERTSSEGRRNADRYVFRYVPDIAFHESQDGDLDDSDLEEYRQRQKASIKAVE
jgi:hypothetical protein